MAEFDYDFLIVGSGFGGSVSALRLSEKGYDVGVLEQGRRYQARDFPKTSWNLKKFLWLPELGCHGIFKMTLMSDVFVLSGAGVGGGSLVYANTLYVPPDAFFASPQWPEGTDWKEALMPHYRMAQFMLGVTQNTYEGEAEHKLKEIAEEMGRGETYMRTPVGVYFGEPKKTVPDPYFGGAGPDRTGCHLCGGCMVGCRFGSKNTLDRNYLYFAQQLGCQVHPERKVTDIRALESGGYAITHEKTGRLWAKDRQTWTAQKVVLSAGVLGTVKLLFTARERGSLPRVSAMLGQQVRTNSEAILGVRGRKKDVNYSEGIAITSSIHPNENTHVEIVRYNEGSDALATLSTPMTDGNTGRPRPIEWLLTIGRNPMDFLRGLWPFGWARRSIILLVMQTLDNSIGLRMRRSWRSLWRKALDSSTEKEDTIPAYIPEGNDVTRRMAEKIDGIPSSSITEVLFDIPTTAHILGGAVMGEAPEDGVIDAQNEVFGHPGLYVCDGSMVPANLGVNPSLTITAMTEHAMSQIPVKDGHQQQHAVDPEWVAARIQERKQRHLDTGDPNRHD